MLGRWRTGQEESLALSVWAENEVWRVRRGEGRVQEKLSHAFLCQYLFFIKFFIDIIINLPCCYMK